MKNHAKEESIIMIIKPEEFVKLTKGIQEIEKKMKKHWNKYSHYRTGRWILSTLALIDNKR